MNNNFNINAVEIVKKKKKKKPGLFSSACNAYFSHHFTTSNILVKLPNLLTCGDKALTSPSTGIARYHL